MKDLDCSKDLIREVDGFPGASTLVTYCWRDPAMCQHVDERITDRKARQSRQSAVVSAALAALACGPIMHALGNQTGRGYQAITQ